MVHVLTHRVLYEFFMLACHVVIVWSFLYCIYLLLHASVPSHFLPSVSPFSFLAPLAIGLASPYPASLDHCWSQGIQTYTCWPAIPIEDDSYLHLFLPVWLKASQICVVLFHTVWLPVMLHKKRCFWNSLCSTLPTCPPALRYKCLVLPILSWTSWLQMEIWLIGM